MIATARMLDSRSRGWRTIATGLAACALFLTGSVAHAAGEVNYRDGKLWITVDEMPAETVLVAVSQRTGMTIVVPRSLREKLVSVTAAGLPVQAAIDRLLRIAGYSNYVLVYEADGRAGRLLIVDRDREPRPGPPVSHVSGEPAPTVRTATSPASRSLNSTVTERALAAAQESGKPPAPMGAAATPGSSNMPSRTPAPVSQPIRQQIAAWKTLSAAERHQVREYMQRLPLAERVELTVYLRHHVLGHPLDD